MFRRLTQAERLKGKNIDLSDVRKKEKSIKFASNIYA